MEILSQIGTATDSAGRRALAREVAKMFFAAEERGMEFEQADKFGEILCRLLTDMPLMEQMDLSERMAETVHAPRDLIVTMAKEDIAVAQPVLTNSKVLTDDDLVSISTNSSTEHRLAMSKRDALSEKVTDSLISFEEGIVMRSVASNEGAKISDDGFSTLTRNANGDAELLDKLASRSDIPKNSGQQILAMLDAAGKEKLSALMMQNNESFSALVQESKNQASHEKIAESKHRINAKFLADEVKGGRRSLPEVTLMLIQEKRPKCIATVFSTVSLLAEKKVYHAIVSTNGELLALMARALELPFEIYRHLDVLRCELVRMSSASEEKLKEAYETLDVAAAQKTMRLVNIHANAS